MCKLMYPYVPHNMRSPEGVQLMMSDPEIRDKLENALQQAFKVGLPSPLCHIAVIAALLLPATGPIHGSTYNLASGLWQANSW